MRKKIIVKVAPVIILLYVRAAEKTISIVSQIYRRRLRVAKTMRMTRTITHRPRIDYCVQHVSATLSFYYWSYIAQQ